MLSRISLSFAVLVFGFFTSFALHPRQEFAASPALPIQNSNQSTPQLNKTIDLSGSYIGKLEYSELGLSGMAQLTINGNNFVLESGSTKLAGRIEAVMEVDHLRVRMTFTPRDGSGGSSILLNGWRTETQFLLWTAPGESRVFRFARELDASDLATSGRRPRARARLIGRGLAGIAAASDDLNSTATNRSRTLPTNPSANANISRPKTPTSLPKNSNSSAPRFSRKVSGGTKAVTSNRNARLPKESSTSAPPSRPNINARATSANSFPSPMASSDPNVSANPNATGLSQIRGNANLAFTTPDKMKIREIVDIELVVNPSKSSEELINSLSEPGRTGSGSTEYADRMEATLVGSGFDITPACPPIQLVEPGHTTRWKWQVKAKEGGAQRLDLTLNAVLNDGKDRTLVQTFHREIRIEVSWKERAAGAVSMLKDVQWLWAFIIVPIAGAVYGWWRKKRQQPSNVAS